MSTKVKEILNVLGNPKSKVFTGTGEDGSQYEATLFWYNNNWRIIDYLEPIALKYAMQEDTTKISVQR